MKLRSNQKQFFDPPVEKRCSSWGPKTRLKGINRKLSVLWHHKGPSPRSLPVSLKEHFFLLPDRNTQSADCEPFYNLVTIYTCSASVINGVWTSLASSSNVDVSKLKPCQAGKRRGSGSCMLVHVPAQTVVHQLRFYAPYICSKPKYWNNKTGDTNSQT